MMQHFINNSIDEAQDDIIIAAFMGNDAILGYSAVPRAAGAMAVVVSLLQTGSARAQDATPPDKLDDLPAIVDEHGTPIPPPPPNVPRMRASGSSRQRHRASARPARGCDPDPADGQPRRRRRSVELATETQHLHEHRRRPTRRCGRRRRRERRDHLAAGPARARRGALRRRGAGRSSVHRGSDTSDDCRSGSPSF